MFKTTDTIMWSEYLILEEIENGRIRIPGWKNIGKIKKNI